MEEIHIDMLNYRQIVTQAQDQTVDGAVRWQHYLQHHHVSLIIMILVIIISVLNN